MRLVIILLLFIPTLLSAQQVFFCESVDRLGIPKNASKEFTIGSDGGFIKILVKQNKEIGSENVVFDVYKLENGKEHFNNTLKMSIQPAVTWFYKEITFFKSGDYNVYVYDERDKLLGVGTVKINLNP